MELKEALKHLITSDAFKNFAKQKDAVGSRYRQFLSRYRRGEIKNGVAFDLLIEHGYRIDIKKPK
jgi:hypothetical protein